MAKLDCPYPRFWPKRLSVSATVYLLLAALTILLYAIVVSAWLSCSYARMERVMGGGGEGEVRLATSI